MSTGPRCIIYNTHFDHDCVSETLIFQFKKGLESCVWRKYTPEDSDVHRFGSEVAAVQNERIAARKVQSNKEPAMAIPCVDRRYYTGFCSLSVYSARIEEDEYKVDVRHDPENGKIEHVTVELIFKSDLSKGERARVRTEAGLIIARNMMSTVAHIPDEDKEDDCHPLKRWGIECLIPSSYGDSVVLPSTPLSTA